MRVERGYRKLTSILLVALLACTALPGSRGSANPIEPFDLIEMSLGLQGFQVLDSHDSFFRGSTGEMYVRVDSVWQDEYPNEGYRPFSTALIEGIVPMKPFEFIHAAYPLGVLLYHRYQCFMPSRIHVTLRVYEDDTDGEVLAAFRSLARHAASFAAGRPTAIVQPLASFLLEETGLQDDIEALGGQLREDVREALEDEFDGDAAFGIACLLANQSLDHYSAKYSTRADSHLRHKAQELNVVQVLNAAMNWPELVRLLDQLFLGGLIDQGINGMLDAILGSGPDLVGCYAGTLSLQPATPATPLPHLYSIYVNTDEYDAQEKTGASLRFGVGVRVAESCSPACNRPPVAGFAVTPGDEVAAGTCVVLDARSATTDPDLENPTLNEQLSYAWTCEDPAHRTMEPHEYLGASVAYVLDKPGVWTFTLRVTDVCGTSDEVTRTIVVIGYDPPVVTPNVPVHDDVAFDPLGNMWLECESSIYIDPGATAIDSAGTDLTSRIVIGGDDVAISEVGVYTVTYDATDSRGTAAEQVARKVYVVDTQPPVISLNGPAEVTVDRGTAYQDPGASAYDLCCYDVPVAVGGDVVNTQVPGEYVITYSAIDGYGNWADPVTRVVRVVDPDVVYSYDAESGHFHACSGFETAWGRVEDLFDGFEDADREACDFFDAGDDASSRSMYQEALSHLVQVRDEIGAWAPLFGTTESLREWLAMALAATSQAVDVYEASVFRMSEAGDAYVAEEWDTGDEYVAEAGDLYLECIDQCSAAFALLEPVWSVLCGDTPALCEAYELALSDLSDLDLSPSVITGFDTPIPVSSEHGLVGQAGDAIRAMMASFAVTPDIASLLQRAAAKADDAAMARERSIVLDDLAHVTQDRGDAAMANYYAAQANQALARSDSLRAEMWALLDQVRRIFCDESAL